MILMHHIKNAKEVVQSAKVEAQKARDASAESATIIHNVNKFLGRVSNEPMQFTGPARGGANGRTIFN